MNQKSRNLHPGYNNRLDDSNFENTGNELRSPPFQDILLLRNVIPLIVFFIAFRILSHYIKKFAWQNAHGFRQYRLQNLTICIIHSTISGGFVVLFTIWNPFAMFSEPLHWYQPWSRYVLLMSMGYFFHDIVDMLQYEVSKFTVELILHHLVSAFVFACIICARKFIPFGFLALLMEANSIFLHARTLMQLSGYAPKSPMIFKLVQYLNLITFVVVRFGVQLWQANWLLRNYNHISTFFFILGIGGCTIFLIINTCLLIRILASDGYLGEFGRKHAAINRDDPAKKEE